jgi:hypothetical protein
MKQNDRKKKKTTLVKTEGPRETESGSETRRIGKKRALEKDSKFEEEATLCHNVL